MNNDEAEFWKACCLRLLCESRTPAESADECLAEIRKRMKPKTVSANLASPDNAVSHILAKYPWAEQDVTGSIRDRRRDDIIIDAPPYRNASWQSWRTPTTPALVVQYSATLDDAISLVDWESWDAAPGDNARARADGGEMRFRVTMRDPDKLCDAIDDAARASVADLGLTHADDAAAVIGVRRDRFAELAGTWFEYGKYLTVEIDTEAKTCRVVPLDETEGR